MTCSCSLACSTGHKLLFWWGFLCSCWWLKQEARCLLGCTTCCSSDQMPSKTFLPWRAIALSNNDTISFTSSFNAFYHRDYPRNKFIQSATFIFEPAKLYLLTQMNLKLSCIMKCSLQSGNSSKFLVLTDNSTVYF